MRVEKTLLPLLAATLIVLFSTKAGAQSAAPSDSGASDNNVICADRPSKSNGACTVPQGMWQIETDVGNYTHDNEGGVVTDTMYYLNPYLKYGVSKSTDIEVNWAPAETVRTRENGRVYTQTGISDLYLRVKTEVYSGSVVSLAIVPYVKAPTANHYIGNGLWEGGVLAPLQFSLPANFQLSLGPEIDELGDASGKGHHVAYSNVYNLNYSFNSHFSMSVEYWTEDDHDPAGFTYQRSADLSFAYIIGKNTQLDAGINIGLNHVTPEREIILGYSYRF